MFQGLLNLLLYALNVGSRGLTRECVTAHASLVPGVPCYVAGAARYENFKYDVESSDLSIMQ